MKVISLTVIPKLSLIEKVTVTDVLIPRPFIGTLIKKKDDFELY